MRELLSVAGVLGALLWYLVRYTSYAYDHQPSRTYLFNTSTGDAGNSNACKMLHERMNAASSKTGQVAFDAAVSGLVWNQRCSQTAENRALNRAILLTAKAFEEHGLHSGDYETDFTEASQAFIDCAADSATYGTHQAAQCQTWSSRDIEMMSKFKVSDEMNGG